MKKFTYIEYLKYQEYIGNIGYFEQVLKEDEQIYQYNHEIYHKHDKIVRKILEDKKEVVSFINKALKLENKKEALKENEIEKYAGKFVTHTFRYAETDVIYRKKDQDIFFLIEHQSTIDYSMPYRILMYSLEVMKRIVDEKQLKKRAYKLPMIYPIILYTGNKKWNVERYIEAKQQKILGCEPARFYEYNVFDINEYSENELLKDEMFLSKIMLLEKSTTSQQIVSNLRKILKKDLTEKNVNFLRRLILYIFDKEIGEKESQELLQELKLKKGGNDMIEELLRKGFREEAEKMAKKMAKRMAKEEAKKMAKEEAKKMAKEEAKKMAKEEAQKIVKKEVQIAEQQIKAQWIIKMIKNEMEENEILEITEISKQDLEEIKNKIEEKAS